MMMLLNFGSLCAGSTFILPSPAKPVMLPVSVMGQNAMGPVQMVHSQVIQCEHAVLLFPSIPEAEPTAVAKSFPSRFTVVNCSKLTYSTKWILAYLKQYHTHLVSK